MGTHFHIELGHNHTMVSPALCTSRGTSDENILDVTTPHNDEINHVPMFRGRVHPHSLSLMPTGVSVRLGRSMFSMASPTP